MTNSPDALRDAMINAAEEQLRSSNDYDIATRAVCEAVGVTQPVLYRLFGDKRGLMDAVAEAGMKRYSDRKAELEATADPIADLRAGWDDHLAFADENPALYQIMFTPRPWSASNAREEVLHLLIGTLTRVSAVGALAIQADMAARMILAANVGLALDRIRNPEIRDNSDLANSLRDAVFTAVLTEPPVIRETALLPTAARSLGAILTLHPSQALAREETDLLQLWLERLSREN